MEGQRITVAGVQTRSRAIKAMCWAGGYDRFCLARADGVVSVWSDAKEVRDIDDAAGLDGVTMDDGVLMMMLVSCFRIRA